MLSQKMRKSTQIKGPITEVRSPMAFGNKTSVKILFPKNKTYFKNILRIKAKLDAKLVNWITFYDT